MFGVMLAEMSDGRQCLSGWACGLSFLRWFFLGLCSPFSRVFRFCRFVFLFGFVVLSLVFPRSLFAFFPGLPGYERREGVTPGKLSPGLPRAAPNSLKGTEVLETEGNPASGF